MLTATLITCAADRVALDKHSFLGPIDPKITLTTALGLRMVSAQAILDQFDRAREKCTDPEKLTAWLPILNQNKPDLPVQCENALAMSTQLAKTWLKTYMFKELEDRTYIAKSVADWLAEHKEFKS